MPSVLKFRSAAVPGVMSEIVCDTVPLPSVTDPAAAAAKVQVPVAAPVTFRLLTPVSLTERIAPVHAALVVLQLTVMVSPRLTKFSVCVPETAPAMAAVTVSETPLPMILT